MIQKFSIVLWRKADPSDKGFDEIAKETYETLCILQKYDEIIRPNYLTVKKKSDAYKFEWNYQTFSEALRNGVMKNEKNEMTELGYSLAFFSSLNENESSGISIRVGNKDARFINSLIISLPISIDFTDNGNSCMLKKLFCELTKCFGQYWGCVSNNRFQIGELGYMSGNNPLYLHWLNYWSQDVISAVNSKFFERIMNMPEVSFVDGVLLLKENAFNCESEKDKTYFEEINKCYLSTII